MRPTQDTRVAELKTPLGKDKLIMVRFDASEGLSELYDINVDCESEDRIEEMGALLGKESSVLVRTIADEDTKRYFSGIVVEARYLGATKREKKDVHGYRLTLRPWTWLLSHSNDSRIFQQMKVEEIIKKVFDTAGFSDYRFSLQQGYSPLAYCVQYRETHLDFVLRLMEEFGIFYYFEHEDGKHTMVLTDSKSLKDIETLSTIDLIPMGARTRGDAEYLRGWVSERSFQTGSAVVSSYDFTKPNQRMVKAELKEGDYAHDKFEVFAYEHKYTAAQASTHAESFAKAMVESRQALDHRRYAEGNAPSLYPGGCVTLQEHQDDSENLRYVVVAARHSVIAQHYRSGGGGAPGDSYSGNYVLQPADQQFRAPQVTPRPIIHGPQTAIVVGPEGEEIHTDKYGRVKVMFHWDRDARGERRNSSGQGGGSGNKPNEHASRWVRVAHTWSGKEWGSFYIPRIGMEVVVEFIEGDPDRPLVVGTVYNAINMPPVDLPANKTQRGLKTRSTKDGSPENYNELWFEDLKGEELVNFHAEKDFKATIENTETRVVKGKMQNGPGTTTRSATIEIGDDVLEVKDGDRNTTISRHHKVDIGKNETITIGGNQDVTITGNETHTISGNQSHTITKEIMIEAGMKLTLKVGASTIEMTPAGITIKTMNLEATGMMTKVNGDGMLIATGGLIKLN